MLKPVTPWPRRRRRALPAAPSCRRARPSGCAPSVFWRGRLSMRLSQPPSWVPRRSSLPPSSPPRSPASASATSATTKCLRRSPAAGWALASRSANTRTSSIQHGPDRRPPPARGQGGRSWARATRKGEGRRPSLRSGQSPVTGGLDEWVCLWNTDATAQWGRALASENARRTTAIFIGGGSAVLPVLLRRCRGA